VVTVETVLVVVGMVCVVTVIVYVVVVYVVMVYVVVVEVVVDGGIFEPPPPQMQHNALALNPGCNPPFSQYSIFQM
jgi:hypothetical protein